jgi:hypothetical protein
LREKEGGDAEMIDAVRPRLLSDAFVLSMGFSEEKRKLRATFSEKIS